MNSAAVCLEIDGDRRRVLRSFRRKVAIVRIEDRGSEEISNKYRNRLGQRERFRRTSSRETRVKTWGWNVRIGLTVRRIDHEERDGGSHEWLER